MKEDSELLPALKRRESEAFTQLFNLYSDKLFRLASSLLNNEDEAECVVQDSFLKFFEKLDQFEGRSTIGTWLYRVAFNLSQDILRTRGRNTPLFEDRDDETSLPIPAVFIDWNNLPELSLSVDEMSSELEMAVANLPEKLKVVFLLREIEGLSTQACADVLSLTVSTTKVRLHRARLLLREALAQHFQGRATRRAS